MRATLTFNLPEDKEDLKLAQNGVNYSLILYHLDQDLLRKNIKYGMSEEIRDRIIQRVKDAYESDSAIGDLNPEVVTRVGTEVLEIVREELYNLANEYGVELV